MLKPSAAHWSSSMTEPLSPAAATVLKEYKDSWTADPFEMDIGALAAALRAAALYCKRDRLQLIVIAEELEQLDDN
jgi:hypothetical protein